MNVKPFPAVFVNHGGGPMPLMGRQPDLVKHMKEVANKILPSKPKAIVVLSAHWEESRSVHISSSSEPLPLLFDYGGFPPETYEYEYPSPGAPELSKKIQGLMESNGIDSRLNEKRGFDHGVFVPLKIMYPEADIPVVSVSMDASLDAQTNMNIGRALAPLREEGILILGSGYTFHNLPKFFRPTAESHYASLSFDNWLQDTLAKNNQIDADERQRMLADWHRAPGARMCHPREEHLLPLLMVSASAKYNPGKVIFMNRNVDDKFGSEHAVSGYLFE